MSPLERASVTITEVLLLALSFLAGLAVAASLLLVGIVPADAPWQGVVIGSVAIGCAGLTYLGIEQLLARHDGPALPLVPAGERKSVGMSVVIALAGFVVALTGSTLLSVVQQELLSIEVSEQEAILTLVAEGSKFDLALLGVSAVILAPVSEELLFRHMFFRRLLHRAGPTLAWILPALAFALFHYNLPGLAIYTWLGLVFAYAYLLSGRLWVAMAVHASHNAVVLSALLWYPELV
jgi:membrane protease YdiL (CAAX protease family)